LILADNCSGFRGLIAVSSFVVVAAAAVVVVVVLLCKYYAKPLLISKDSVWYEVQIM